MKNLISSFSVLIQRKDSRVVVIVSTVIFLLLLLLIQNGKSAYQIYNFEQLSYYKRLTLSLLTFFDITSTFTTSALILAILGSLLGGINIALAYTYMKMRGEVIVKSGLYSGTGLILAFIGIGCAACGTAFLSVILGIFGFSAVLQVLPYQGQEIGYIGLLLLSIATYVLAQKLSAPNVC